MCEHDDLLEQFKAAYEAGERPELAQYLERASPEGRQALEQMIDSYLMNAPRRSWDPDAYAASPARESVERVWGSLQGVSGSWPELLPHLRNRAKLKRSELVQRLAETLGVAGREEKVALYYHRMEHGQLPAEGVSGGVFDALGSILGESAELIRRAGFGRLAAAEGEGDLAAFARTAEIDEVYAEELHDEAAELPAPGSAPGRDEVDELFTGG